MTLLLDSGIEARVQKYIRGRVGRIGGTVNQLIDYRDLKVEDLNVEDGGFGDVMRFRNALNPRKTLGAVKRYVKQEMSYWRHGARVARDRKTWVIDVHHANTDRKLFRRFDALISSNVIEHSPNPIFFLLNAYLLTKQNGYQFHAIPNYRYTFDRFRKPTELEHFISDFRQQTDIDDQTHNEDYIQSAIVKHGWQREFHEKYPVAYPYIHFHVFDENNTRQLFELMFEEVEVDVIRTEEFSDNVVIARNALTPDFVSRFEAVARTYGIDLA